MTRDEALKIVAEAREDGVVPDLRDANLRGANLRGANLRWAHLRGTGVIRVYSRYEATCYLDGRLAYGCETHHIDEWSSLLDDLCEKHEPDHAAEYRAEIEAIIALCRVATTRIECAALARKEEE